jgi:hypothetical protein
MNVEDLSRREGRERLSLAQLVWLYLNPFALFKNVTVGPPRSQAEALRWNRRHRGMLVAYLRRWSAIAIACLFTGLPFGALARGEPVLVVPFVGLELAFSFAFCVLLVAAAVYFVLGLKD